MHVVCRALTHLSADSSRFHDCGRVSSGTDDADLRAAAIVACERLVPILNERLAQQSTEVGSATAGAPPAAVAAPAVKLTAMQLDYYLWLLGKDGDMRKVVSLVTFAK